MAARSLALLVLLASLLLPAAASAADYEWRRVITQTGEVYDGVLLEREKEYVLIGLEDGTVVEFLAGQILRIEVIPADPEQRPPPPLIEYEEEVRRPRVPSHLQGYSRNELAQRYAAADEAHITAVGPTIPMLTVGMTFMIASTPFLFEGSPSLITYLTGLGLVVGSFGSAAAGSLAAIRAEGFHEPNSAMQFGMAFGLVGVGMMATGLPIFQLSYGSGPDFFLAGSGMGMAIAGSAVVMAEAKYARDRLRKARRRIKRAASPVRPVPRLVGLSVAPGKDGAAFSAAFVF